MPEKAIVSTYQLLYIIIINISISLKYERPLMRTITFTEFRKNASAFISDVENGAVIQLIRRGRPVAKITPVNHKKTPLPAWKKPGLRLKIKGGGLSEAILQERETSQL
jgi:antitoxin (DNA-binding transcriptional repressor) of toxin-antitoxin stability system